MWGCAVGSNTRNLLACVIGIDTMIFEWARYKREIGDQSESVTENPGWPKSESLQE